MGTTGNGARKKMKEIKTFTYFLPAPPQRKTGYREKEFDKIVHGILQSGFELVELQTQASENGIFIIMILSAPTKKIVKLDEHLDMHEKFKLQDKHSSPDIELDEEDA